MLPSTRALVRVAIVPASIAILAGCLPGSANLRLADAVRVKSEAVSLRTVDATPALDLSPTVPTVVEQPLPAAPLPEVEAPVAEAPVAELPVTDLPAADLPAADLPAADLSAAADELSGAERQDLPPAPPSDITPFEMFDAGPTSAVVTGAMGALVALTSGDAGAYDIALEGLSRSVAAVTGVAADALLDAWSKAADRRMEAVLAALTQVGVNYHYASSSPGRAFDCSGLVSWAWSIAGVDLPHQSSAIIGALPRGDLATVQPGDVLWYPGHVSLALGVGDSFVDAPNPGNTVRIEGRHSASAARRLVVGVMD